MRGTLLALVMVRRGLDPAGLELRIPGPLLAAEVVAQVEAARPGVVCIGSVGPGGLSQPRHLCKRLRARFPDLAVIVGRYGRHGELAAERDALLAAGATTVPTTVQETQRALMEWAFPRVASAPAPNQPVPERKRSGWRGRPDSALFPADQQPVDESRR